MKASWTRRATLALATVSAAALLAACGDGSVVELVPRPEDGPEDPSSDG